MHVNRGRWAVVVGVTAVALLGSSKPSFGQDFAANGALDGHSISATAHFVAGINSVSITLVNLQANPVSVIQAISGILFTATDAGASLTSGTGFQTPVASYISIARGGTVTPAAAPANNWLLGSSAGTYHLNALCGPPTQCGGPSGLIIGPGPYTNANGSIGGNRPHNPFIDQTATFTIALLGATAQTVISNVVLTFGTDGARVGATLVPIPAAVWLFASGVLALFGVAQRRRAAARNAIA